MMRFYIVSMFTLIGLLIGVCSISNAADPKQIRFDELSKKGYVESVDVYPGGTPGKYLVLIPQIHANSFKVKGNESIRSVIAIQQSVVDILLWFKSSQPRMKICPESVFDLEQHLRGDWDETRTSIEDLLVQVRPLIEKRKAKKALQIFKVWREENARIFYPGLVRQYELLAAAKILELPGSEKLLGQAIRKINPFGTTAGYYSGGVKYLYGTSEITRDYLVACEDERTFRKGIDLLQQKDADETKLAEELALLASEREYALVLNVGRLLHSENGPDVIVVVLGALHDLDDEVLQYNKLNAEEKITLVRVIPQHLTAGIKLLE